MIPSKLSKFLIDPSGDGISVERPIKTLETTDTEVGIAYINNKKIIQQLPKNFYTTNYTSLTTIVSDLINANENDLSNESSELYKLFDVLSESNDYEAFNIFYMFFISIDQGLFTLDEALLYFSDNNLDINYDNIVKYLSNLHSYKKEIIKKRLYSGIYGEKGNLIDFFNIKFNNKDNTLFYRVNKIDDPLFKNDAYYILNANINYFGGDEYYRNKRLAEVDYWNIIDNYNTFNSYTEPFQTNIPLIKIIRTLREKTYDSKATGVPFFLEKKLQKNLYMELEDLNDTVIELFKNSYNKLSSLDVLYFIDRMADKIIEYYNYVEINIDYSEDTTDLPDLDGLVSYMVTEFITKHTHTIYNNISEEYEDEVNISTITLQELKEMTFYILGIFEFYDVTNIEYELLRTILLGEYASTRTILLNIWNELKHKGKYI